MCEPAYRIALTHCARRGTDRNRRFLKVAKNRHMAYSHSVCTSEHVSGSIPSKRGLSPNRWRRPGPEPMRTQRVESLPAAIVVVFWLLKNPTFGLFAQCVYLSAHVGLHSVHQWVLCEQMPPARPRTDANSASGKFTRCDFPIFSTPVTRRHARRNEGFAGSARTRHGLHTLQCDVHERATSLECG